MLNVYYLSQINNYYETDTFQVCRFSFGPDQVMFKVQELLRYILNAHYIKCTEIFVVFIIIYTAKSYSQKFNDQVLI